MQRLQELKLRPACVAAELMSRPPPTARVRPALSIQVAQLRGDDDASPGEASPGSAAGPLKRVSPRKGVSRHVPYPMSTSPLVAGESQTPGLSSKLADFSMLTPRDDADERPVSTRTRRRSPDTGFGTRKTSPLGADVRATDAPGGLHARATLDRHGILAGRSGLRADHIGDPVGFDRD